MDGDRGAGTRENKRWRWAGSGRRRSGMRESFEGGRREKNEGHKVLNDFLVTFKQTIKNQKQRILIIHHFNWY